MARGLTDLTIRNAKPRNSGFYLIADGGGLYLRITPRGKKVWHFDRKQGKRHRFDFGTYPAMSLVNARAEAIKYSQMLNNGIDPKAAKQKTILGCNTAPTLEEYARASFFPHLESGRKKFKECESYFTREVFPDIGQIKLQDIERIDVTSVINKVVKRKVPAAANRLGALLRQFFDYADYQGVIKHSPFPKAQKKYMGGIEQSRDRALDVNEIMILWHAATELGFPFGPYLKLLLLTGQRRNELLLAKKSDLRLNHKNPVWISAKENLKQTKASPVKQDHWIPLCPLAVQLFRECILAAGNSELIFPNANHKPFEKNAPNKYLYGYEDKTSKSILGIAHWTPHDLRRTMATRMAEDLQIPPHVIELIQHHKLKGMAAIYNRARYLIDSRKALNAWGKHLQQIVDGEVKEVSYA